MIRIRYRDPNELSPGLHAAAERHGRHTTVYMIPGLTSAERRSALRRLRISARMGYGPRLPAAQLALALLADRVRTTVGQAGAIFRSHPAGSTVPVMVVSAGAIAFLALSAVSIRVIHQPAGPGPQTPFGPTPALSADPLPAAGPSPGPAAGSVGDGLGGLGGLVARPQAGTGSTRLRHPGSGADPEPASSAAGGGTGGGTTLTGGTDPSNPSPSPSSTGASSSPAARSASPAASSAAPNPSATPAPSSSGLCVHLGPLGVCL